MGNQNRFGMHLVHLSEDLHKDFARLVARQIQAVHYNARWSESESLFMWDIKISDGDLPGAYEYSTPYGEPLMVDFA